MMLSHLFTVLTYPFIFNFRSHHPHRAHLFELVTPNRTFNVQVNVALFLFTSLHFVAVQYIDFGFLAHPSTKFVKDFDAKVNKNN